MKAYVINLRRDVERRRLCEQRLAAAPMLDVEFIEAVDGRAMSEAERRKAFDYERFAQRKHCLPTPGEAGCALSHYKVWQRIADGNDDVVLVLEDDITFIGDLTPLIDDVKKLLASNRPQILLSSNRFYYRKASVTAIGRSGLGSAEPLHAWHTHCYYINRTAARLLISLGQPCSVADDWDYYASRGLDLRALLGGPVEVDNAIQTGIPCRSLPYSDGRFGNSLIKRFNHLCESLLPRFGWKLYQSHGCGERPRISIKAYAINLASDTRRREELRQRLASTPLCDVEIFAATDGRAMSDTERREAFDFAGFASHNVGSPTPGEVGCALSHYRLWQRIAAGNDNAALILEDDATIDCDFQRYIDFAVDYLAFDTPRIVAFPGHFYYTRMHRVADGVDVARPIRGYYAYCYFINRAAARRLVNLGRPHYVADDWNWFVKHGVEVLAVFEDGVNFNHSYKSNIEERSNWSHDWPLSKKLRAAIPHHLYRIISRIGLLNVYDKD